MSFVFLVCFLFGLSSCGYIHTKASLENSKNKPQDERPEAIQVDKDKWVEVENKEGVFSYQFSEKQTEKVMEAFVKVLELEKYSVSEKNLEKAVLQAELLEKGLLASGNASFNTSSNYLLSEGVALELRLERDLSGVIAFLKQSKIKEYSMGQREIEAFENISQVRELFTKVKLAL